MVVVTSPNGEKAPPALAAITMTSFSDIQIDLAWTAPTSPTNGDASVISYEVYWDEGTAVTPYD